MNAISEKGMIMKNLAILPHLKFILLFAAFAGITGCAPQEGEGTKVFVNGAILTMNDVQATTEAVAVKDGKILAVGSRAEVEKAAGSGAEVVDLGGKTLMPGFIDAHGHVFLTAAKLTTANLSPELMGGTVKNIADLQRVLREFKERNNIPPGEWIYGMGYDDTALEENRHPTKEELDEVSTEHPGVARHISGHLMTVNSKALELVGYTADTPDPEGGVIQRKPGSREPNGVLEELAMYGVLKVVPSPGEQESIKGIEAALEYYASNGFTTAQEGALKSPGAYHLFKKMAASGEIPIDLVGYPFYKVADELLANYETDREYDGRFRVGGIKLVVDGALQGYTGFLSKPYYVQPGKGEELEEPLATSETDDLIAGSEGAPKASAKHETSGGDYRGYSFFDSQEGLDEWVIKSYAKNWPIIAHTNGDAATDMLIEAVRKAETAYPGKDRRTTIIHAQTIREDQLDAAKKLGMIPSFFPYHIFYWGDRHRDIFLGPERAARISPAKSALDRGMVFTGHHDSPIVPANALDIVWCMVNRITSGGAELGPEQRIPVEEALKAVSINAAYQHFEEDSKGSIETGKLADFIILSENPLKVDPMKIKDIEVLETIKEGQTVFKKL